MKAEIANGVTAKRAFTFLEDVVKGSPGRAVDALAAPALPTTPDEPAKPTQHALQVAAPGLFAFDRLEQRLEVANTEAA